MAAAAGRSRAGNVCCVGDDDQSIYGWRGAEVDNILRFERDFPGAKVVRLERNYRSTSHILAAASGLIAANKDRLGKTLWTEDRGRRQGRVRGVWDGEAESRLIADEIETARRSTTGEPALYSDMAILVRASFQMRAFEERFVMLPIPYTVIGGPRFFERAEIRDAHAYLRLIQSDGRRPGLRADRQCAQARHRRHHACRRSCRSPALNGVSAMTAVRDLIALRRAAGAHPHALSNFVRDLDRWRGCGRRTPHGG